MINLMANLKRLSFIRILCLLLIFPQLSIAQNEKIITIDSCYALARLNYPLIKQRALLEKTNDYTIDNASKGYLPQLNINGQATYQSDVTKIPISSPNLSFKELSKDQYKIYGEINQSITDPFIIKQQKEFIRKGTESEEQKIEVELYKLKDRINQLFFGILMFDEQIKLAELLKKDIKIGIAKTNAAIASGTALKSNADVLLAESLKLEQREIELKSGRKGFSDMLALFINQSVDEVKFSMPENLSVTEVVNRPEIKLFEIKRKSLDVQNKLLNAKNFPRISLFLQGGYGRPALNFLNNEFDTYYLGGVKLNWNVSGLYTLKRDKDLVTLNQESLDIEKEIFLFNINFSLKQQFSELNKFQQLIGTDNKIIELREKIQLAANSQLENGIISANDFLIYINAVDQARQNLILHRVQLLITQYAYQNISGN